MAETILRLIYPSHLLDVPVINQLIRSYDLTVNILRAQVTPDEGWVEIQLSGESNSIADAIAWLTDRGIEVAKLDE